MNVYNESNTKINARYTHCIAAECIMSVKAKTTLNYFFYVNINAFLQKYTKQAGCLFYKKTQFLVTQNS